MQHISVAVIKYLDKKQPRRKGVFYSLQYQATVCYYGGVERETSASHIISIVKSREKSVHVHLLTLLLLLSFRHTHSSGPHKYSAGYSGLGLPHII